MLSEKELIIRLETILVKQVHFQTYLELQITSKHLDLQRMIDQEQFRIDLAAISQIDSSIHFFEAETQLHLQHPVLYRKFCDYCYLVCPEEQFEILDSITKKQQLSWAEETGVGIITISKEGALRVRLHAKKQLILPEVRKEVIRAMNKRYHIHFSTLPLWERSRNSHSKGEA
ncbi:MAG: hypothetical protein ACFFB5_05650 [Promethearchaeota archaeon]